MVTTRLREKTRQESVAGNLSVDATLHFHKPVLKLTFADPHEPPLHQFTNRARLRCRVPIYTSPQTDVEIGYVVPEQKISMCWFLHFFNIFPDFFQFSNAHTKIFYLDTLNSGLEVRREMTRGIRIWTQNRSNLKLKLGIFRYVTFWTISPKIENLKNEKLTPPQFTRPFTRL
jgi:hypothetical protein